MYSIFYTNAAFEPVIHLRLRDILLPTWKEAARRSSCTIEPPRSVIHLKRTPFESRWRIFETFFTISVFYILKFVSSICFLQAFQEIDHVLLTLFLDHGFVKAKYSILKIHSYVIKYLIKYNPRKTFMSKIPGFIVYKFVKCVEIRESLQYSYKTSDLQTVAGLGFYSRRYN